MSLIIKLFLLTLTTIYLVNPTPIQPNNIFANDIVTTCDQTIAMYSQVGYPVTDCIFMDKFLPYLYYRIDTKMTFQEARLACKTAQNADLATASLDPDDQMNLNDLYRNKFILDTWMWLGIYRDNNNTLRWIDNSGIPAPSRWYPYADSTTNGDCAVMLVLTDNEGVNDMAGTFYYTEDCNNKYIAVCQASIP